MTDHGLLLALASLAEHAPERMRCSHLAAPARELAERLKKAEGQACAPPDPDVTVSK